MPIDVDFARLRPWGRGQDTAFEELCCQIARAKAVTRGHQFVRLGTPDGGVEGYEIDADDNEHGLQAKFFLGKPTSSQWNGLFNSIKRAIEKHPQLIELTIALAADREDPRKPREQWFMDEWNQQHAKWIGHAESLGRTVTFPFMGKSEIADAMSREEHAGRYRWWFDQHLLSGRWLSGHLEEVIGQVGPRYNQDLTVDVPAGGQLVQFARSPELLLELDDLAAEASDLAAKLASANLGDDQVDEMVESVISLPRPVTGSGPVPGPHVTPPFDIWHESWRAVSQQSELLIGKYFREDERRNRATPDWTVSSLHELSGRAMGLLWHDARAYQATAMLLWGDAGVGKTHSLCDLATEALAHGQPAVVILGQQLGTGQPWRQILDNLGFAGTAEEFLQALSARAEATGQRALLLIDAINENNGPTLWPDHMGAFLTLIRRYPWIGVVLSVRTTARSLLIPSHIGETELLPVQHTGFAKVPIDALITFFDFYGLPLPTAPLAMYQELMNPLFLRLYCKAATTQPGLLTSPLPGLTRIVEAILKDIDVRARQMLRADPYQEIMRPVCQALAIAMRQHRRAFLTRPEATEIANAAIPDLNRGEYARTPLAVVISEGLLAEDFVIDGTPQQPLPVVRFAFERIGDHLRAEALLKEAGRHGEVSPDDVLDGLADALSTFDMAPDDYSADYRLRSTLEALAVVLPERLSRELPDLIAVLKTKIASADQSAAPWVENVWLTSLTTREPSAFSEATRGRLSELVVGTLEQAAYPLSDMRRTAIRIALALSVHPDQPLGPEWLHNLLAPLRMPERDRRWTAQIRGTNSADTPYSTLIYWCRAAPRELLATAVGGGRSFARLAASALMWALPSSDRFLRDSATRALVALTHQDTLVITDLLQAVSEVDDGYILERVLAVACASALRGTVEARNLASALRQFLDRCGLPKHVLARDYLVITVNSLIGSLGHDTVVSALVDASLPPYPPEWPGPLGQPSLAALTGQYPPFPPSPAVHPPHTDPREVEAQRRRRVASGYVSITSSIDEMGDFNRYVMHIDKPYSFRFAKQRLDEPVGAGGLENFDMELLPGWIFARVLELGWSPQAFGETDIDIDAEDSGRTSHKRERLGKKYQWLAWHEALARLSGTQRFRDDTNREREIPYESAWQLGFVRDMDPTHLRDLRADQPKDWRTLWRLERLTLDATVAAGAGGDGPAGHVDTARSREEHARWWFPVSKQPQPALPLSADAIEELSTWAINNSGLPDLAPYLVIHADLEQWVNNGRVGQPVVGPRYRLLYVTDHLLERPREGLYPYADLLINVDSVLIRRTDLPAIQQWPGSQPLDGFALDVSITDAIFLGEWPDGPSYLANCEPGFRPRTWQEAAGTDRIGLGAPAIVATERYCWEGNIYDCSLPGTLNIHLLTAAAATLFPGIRQRDGVARTAEGALVHLDPHPAPDADGTLLVNEQLLADALVREDLILLQIIQQSKRVFLGMGDNRFAGETHSTRLIGTVGEEMLLDITRGETLPARLHLKSPPKIAGTIRVTRVGSNECAPRLLRVMASAVTGVLTCQYLPWSGAGSHEKGARRGRPAPPGRYVGHMRRSDLAPATDILAGSITHDREASQRRGPRRQRALGQAAGERRVPGVRRPAAAFLDPGRYGVGAGQPAQPGGGPGQRLVRLASEVSVSFDRARVASISASSSSALT